MKKTTLAAAAAATLALAAGPALAEDKAFGLWLTESKRVIVEIGPCDGAPSNACGKVVWLVEPTDDKGAPRVDEKNPEESLRSRTLCGLPVVGDFKKASDGSWEDGFIYDAGEGDMYDAYLEPQDDGTLKVRGYLLISALGKSQIWTRVDDNRGGC